MVVCKFIILEIVICMCCIVCIPSPTCTHFNLKEAYWISSNIAIALFDFSLLLPIYLSLSQLCDSKVVALNLFA